MIVLGFIYGVAITLLGNVVHLAGMILAAPGQVVRVLGLLLIQHASRVINACNAGRPWIWFPRTKKGGFKWGRMR